MEFCHYRKKQRQSEELRPEVAIQNNWKTWNQQKKLLVSFWVNITSLTAIAACGLCKSQDIIPRKKHAYDTVKSYNVLHVQCTLLTINV